MGGTLISNTTACVLSGRPAATCLFFAAFNFTNCVYETERLMPPHAVAPLTPVSRCLNASGCLDMYDVFEKMLKTEDAESFDDGVVKLNKTAAVLRAAAARIVGLRRNHTKS